MAGPANDIKQDLGEYLYSLTRLGRGPFVVLPSEDQRERVLELVAGLLKTQSGGIHGR